MSLSAGRVGVRADQVDSHGRVNSPSFFNEIMEDLPVWTDLPVRVNGTEEVLPSNTSVPVTSPILTDIDYPDIRRNDQYFTYRESPTTVDGLAKIKSIKGNTLVWNQIVQNGNFESTSGWSSNISANTISASSNELTVVINTLAGNVGIWGSRLYKRIANHKYLLKVDVYTPHATTVRFGADNEIQRNLSVGWNTVSGVTQNTGTNIAIVCYITATAAQGFSSGESFKIRNYQCFDLTQMFGAGKEPTTVEEFTSLFSLPYYAYNTGILLSFNGTGIKTANEDISEEHTTTLPISTYFPTGMKSAGTVYDELAPTKAVTRIGAVDLGSLTWSYLSGSTALRFFTTLPSDAKNVDATAVANAITSKYPVASWNSVAPNVSADKMFALTGTYITIRDTSYTDATAFKTAMSGVYLYYELATPVELPTLSFE